MPQRSASEAGTVAGPGDRVGGGAVLLSETLLAVLPGADLVPEIAIDRAAVFESLRAALEDFRARGGAAVVDLGGLTTGRDAELIQLLADVTGVELVVATGFGPSWTIGSHFTNNVSAEGMKVDRIADIFLRELTEGLLVPGRERLTATAGLVAATQSAADAPVPPATKGGPTIESDTFRAAARAAARTGAALAVRVADDPEGALAHIDGEGLPAERILVLGLDRADHVAAGLPRRFAARGHVVGLDHVGWPSDAGYLDEPARARLALDLVEAGLGDRVVVSGGAIGVSVEYPAPVQGDFGAVLRDFAPAFLAAGGTEEQLRTILEVTPRRVLTRAEGA